MSLVDLEKKVGVVLEKRKMLHPPATRVGLLVDGSLSMRQLYRTGVVQKVVDRVLAVAAKFDDDGFMDMWMFDHDSHQLKQAGPSDYSGYVQNEILSKFNINGGTEFHPVMSDVLSFYYPPPEVPLFTHTPSKPGFFGRLFGAKEQPEPVARIVPSPFARPVPAEITPVFAIMIGDGANQDRPEAARLLRSAAKNHIQPIYWQFVGIGDESFSFMRQMADDLPNVGFCEVRRLDQISDEDLYDRILTQEFIDWVRQ